MTIVTRILRWIGAIICIGCAVLLSIATLFVTLGEWVRIRQAHFDAFHFGEMLGTLFVYGIVMAIVVGLCLLAVRLIRDKKKPAPAADIMDMNTH